MIVVIFGPGGVGKGTVVRQLLERDPNLWLSRSWTTRSRRPGEPETAYVFVDRPAFQARIDEGGFLEWDEHFDNLYGTPTPHAPPGRDVLLEIDINGAEQIRRHHPEALIVLVVPPSRQILRERLLQRGDPAADVEARLDRADMEVEEGRRIADHVVINDDLDRAVTEVAGILQKYR